MLVISVIISAAAVYLCGGRLSNIKAEAVKMMWAPIAALALQTAAEKLCVAGVLPRIPFFPVMLTFSYIINACFIYANRKYGAFAFFAVLGTASNYAVIAANGFYMPVSASALKIAGIGAIPAKKAVSYICLSETSRLKFLADIIYWPFPEGFASIGDIFLAVSIFFLLYCVTEACLKEGNKNG